MPKRTIKEARAEIKNRGLTINGWARHMGFSDVIVYQVLSGRSRCERGQAYEVALALGIRDGIKGEYKDLPFATKEEVEQLCLFK